MATVADPNSVSIDASDPYVREAQTFPRLTDEMAQRVAGYGREEALAPGALLFERGQRGVDFFLVLDGEVEIFGHSVCGRANVFTVHSRHQFTGELDLFNDRQILVNGRARGPTRVIRVPRPDFQRLVAAETDLGEIIMRAFILRRVGLIRHAQGGVILIGHGADGDTLRLQHFLGRNGYPHRLLDLDADTDAADYRAHFELDDEAALPAVITPDGRVYRNPDNARLADELGLTEHIDDARVHDVAVVGAGPAGLAAAVYAASEGLDTIVIEGLAPGGQAGTSSKIENYLGFPTGISGMALAGRAQVQAQKFGARLAVSRKVVGLDCEAAPYRLRLEDGRMLRARAVVIATGARYRKLDVRDYDKYEGCGIHYACTAMEAHLCGGQQVVVVGGGNSAGQAAMFLARTVAHVHIVIRGAGLAATMSDYLVQRIESSPRITLHAGCEITALEGQDYLQRVTWRCRADGRTHTHPVGNVFVMIGAEPNTDWLRGCVALDERGFVVTGVGSGGGAASSPFVTTREGVFAVGDVRAGSVKRVASGVGEGSVVVHAIHRYLAPPAA